MRNGIFKYPENRFFGYLPKRIPEPSETRFSDNSVTYGFNDFMTQCRQSPFVRRTASPLNRIRDDPTGVCSHGSGWCDSQIRMETEKQIINN